MILMTPEQEYRNLYESMAQLCADQGWGDPFSYARSKEIYAATVLGHNVAQTFSGADAEEKLAKYSEHYYNRFEDGKLAESWKMSGEDVFNLLLPKLKAKFPTVLTKKDPRLSANITWKEIQDKGTPVFKKEKK